MPFRSRLPLVRRFIQSEFLLHQELYRSVEQLRKLDEERERVRQEAFEALAFADPDLANAAITVFDGNKEKAAAWFASRPSIFSGRMPIEVFKDDREKVRQVLYQIEYGIVS